MDVFRHVDNIFILDAVIIGAGWDDDKLCLVHGEKSGKLGRIKGVPINYKDKVDQDDTMEANILQALHILQNLNLSQWKSEPIIW